MIMNVEFNKRQGFFIYFDAWVRINLVQPFMNESYK